MERIADAVRTIGSIAENDLSPEELVTVASACTLLAEYARSTGFAKQARLNGAIPIAIESEGFADVAYDRLPEGFRW